MRNEPLVRQKHIKKKKGIFMNCAQGRRMLLTMLLDCTFQLAKNVVFCKCYICLTIFYGGNVNLHLPCPYLLCFKNILATNRTNT
jgi:hypothetical protein